MTIHAALLDENGVFVRMDELASPAELTERHLRQIDRCDLRPGEYRWVPDPAAPLRGAFWPLNYLRRVEQDRVDVEKARNRAALRAEQQKQRRERRAREPRRGRRGEP